MTKTTVLVYAGEDVYTMMHVPASLQGNKEAMYQEVSTRVLPRLVQDFGEGAELFQVSGEDPQIYHIRVDKVVA
jgi:hypothetical protein